MKDFFKKYGAYLAAAVLFVSAAIIYCFPEFKGKVVYAGDNLTASGAVQEAIEYIEETGEHTWWNGSMFSGMPSYQIGGGAYHADQWLTPLRSILHKGHGSAHWVLIIYFFCFFILLLSFDVDKWTAIAGAFAVSLSSYFLVIIAAGHGGKTSTIALMSVMLAGFHLIFKKKYGLGAILVMLFIAAGFTTHPQMAYYIFMLTGMLYLAELWVHIREKRMKDFLIASAIFFACVGVGLGTNMANIFANSEYSSQTMRGGHSDIVAEADAENGEKPAKGLDLEYATQWSYGALESFSFLIPGVQGGASAVALGNDSHTYKTLISKGVDKRSAVRFCQGVPLYWGDQPFTAGNVYMGAIVCFLFLLGLIVVDGPMKWGLLAATLFSAALALGSNFMPLTKLFFNYFPLYNKFRAVSSILIVAEITMPLLGFMALSRILGGKVDKRKAAQGVLIAGGVTVAICAFFALLGPSLFSFTSRYDAQFAGSLPGWAYDAIIADRKQLLRSDSLRSMMFIVLAAIPLLLYCTDKLKAKWVVAALGVLVVLDMWPVDKRYFNDNNFVSPKDNSSYFAIQPWESAILQDPGYFRVLNLTVNPFSDSRTSYRLKSIGGYNAAKLRRYQDLIDEHLSKMHMPVLNMLNTKYFITSAENGDPEVTVNPNAMGNAWFVEKLVEVEGAKKESDALMAVDLSSTAVIDKEFVPMVENMAPGRDPEATITLTAQTPDSRDYEYESSVPGCMVFSEIYYPFGWKASIDGEAADHYRVNYMLRAMDVPAGHHTIHFVFDPDSVRKGDSLAMVFILIMYLVSLGLIALGVVRLLKKRA